MRYGYSRKRTIPLIRIVFSAGLVFSLLFQLRVFAYDIVSTVQSPLLGRPCFAVPGGQFTIVCKTGSDNTGWSASLSMPYKEMTLEVTAGAYANGVRTLTAKVPQDAPFELYDLRVRASGGVDDAVQSCVKIIPAFKTDFTFVHLPDCHLPSVSWAGFYDDANTVPEFRQIIREIGIVSPEFVLQTGDIVDNGQDESQYRLAQEYLAEARAPVFITGGNHDLWYDGHTYWSRAFGPAWNFSFLYGSIRFAGLEMYDIPTKTFTAAQMQWLNATLTASIQSGEKSRILFTHFDESRQITGDFIDRYAVDGLFYGHTHLSSMEKLGLRQAFKIGTSYTMNDRGEYRLVKVNNGKISEAPLLRFKRLRMDASPANDGTSAFVTAAVVNDNDTDIPGVLAKLHVKRDKGPFTVSGGRILQFIDYGTNQRVYYVSTDVPAHGSVEVSVRGSAVPADVPKIVFCSPRFDTTLAGGRTLHLEIQASGSNLQYAWKKDGNVISGQTGKAYSFSPGVSFEGRVLMQAEASNANGTDSRSWTVYVEKPGEKPVPASGMRAFFPWDRQAVISWTEPVTGQGVFEYGPVPGQPSGTITEEGSLNRVRFTPSQAGMATGVYYCRIKSGGLASDEFPVVIESPKAPVMIGPLGDPNTLTPVFQWEAVQGVPYYFLIMTDSEIIITENKNTGEYSLEGANPVWAVLTPKTSVAYGESDPSGIFTSQPAPLVPGGRYWWVVLNCYGNRAELASTVQSGVGAFRAASAQNGIVPPVPVHPGANASLAGPSIAFRWNAAAGAAGYVFYLFKLETEEGVEVVRPVWENAATTSNTVYEVDAVRRLVKGSYEWKVAALDGRGGEFPCEMRRFQYDAPYAVFDIRTCDDGGTDATSDDQSLPRVTVAYDALSGVDMGLPLSTDKRGERLGLLFSPGTYVFSAVKEGFAPLSDTLSFTAGQRVQWNARLRPDLCVWTGKAVNGTGASVEAAQVSARHSLFEQSVRRTESDREGRFTFTLSPGPWHISAAKSGYQSSGETAVTARPDEIGTLPSPLVLKEYGNRITGTVVNSAGQAVFGAEVSVKNGSVVQYSATDSEGRFSFPAYDGSWLLSVSKSGFVSPSARTISVSGGKTITISPSPQLGASGSLISGSVTDGQAAVAGAEVRAEPPSGSPVFAVSDAYGQFTAVVSPGYYVLSAGKEGFAASGRTAVTVGSNETATGLLLRVTAASGTLTGLVTLDGFTPLAGAAVLMNDRTALTDAAGRYSFSIPPGRCRVSASKNGYLGGDPVDIRAGAGAVIENVDFILAANASQIRGQASASGGVAGAVISSASGETRTGDSGTYTLNVNAGTHAVTASKTGFQSKSIQVAAGQAQVLEGNSISLTYYPAVLQGTVREYSSGTALMGVRVEAVDSRDGLSTTTRVDGSYRLELDPDTKGVTLRFSKEGYETKTLATGPLSAGKASAFDATLRVFPTVLYGRVLDQNNKTVGEAGVSAVKGAEKFTAVSEPGGTFRLYLPAEGGTVAVSVFKKGYAFPQASENIAMAPGERRNRDFALQSNFARLKVNVSSVSEPFVSRARVQLKTAEGLAASLSADESGAAVFPDLPEGVYDLSSGKAGYKDETITGLSLAAGATRTVSIALTQCTGFLEGQVSDGTTPLSNATVEARLEGKEQSFTQSTGADGSFKLDRIPPGKYAVQVSLSGHTSGQDMAVTAPASGLVFVLAKNKGWFRGKVVDRETGQGIAGAGLVARDGRGNEARGSTSQDGSYDLTLLPSLDAYTLQAYAGGYGAVTRANLSSLKNDTTVFRLQRVTGSIQGKITIKDAGLPAAGAAVRISAGLTAYRDTTDGNGTYRVLKLPVNQYDVTVEKAGHLPSPSYRTVSLWSGGDKTGMDFELEKADLARIAISGPATLESGKAASYDYSAKTEDGRSMSIAPFWSVDLPDAVESFGQDGVLVLKADFIGPLRLALKDVRTGMEDSILVHAAVTAGPSNTEMRLRDYRGAEFIFPAGCAGRNTMLGLKCPETPDAKRLSADYQAGGRVYQLQPDGYALLKPMTVVLPVGEDGSPFAMAGKWNAQRLTWEGVPGKAVQNGIQVESADLGQWTVLEPSEPLGIRQFSAAPNPFSPFVENLNLSFIPTSNASSAVFITVKVFSVNGQLVRSLAMESPFDKGRRQSIAWDGKTDSGADALNGRYFILIEAKDGSGTEKKLISVVLVK